jgi:hypothetical protein
MPIFEYLKPSDNPVVDGLEQHERVYAKDQPEYIPLRALVANRPEATVMSRWTFTHEQRKAIADAADIYLQLSTFNRPLQPIRIVVSDGISADYIRGEFNLPSDATSQADGFSD